ncbi:MAG TPA: ABC transporter ATP-binding protein [Acidimicrobiia bacterium]|nr:ABC transporter ATP-binding protein [Acidimicrobiia bacterium]
MDRVNPGTSRRLEVRDVTKSFEGQPVLRGINLIVEKGTSVTLLGPSGCGKTTLLRVIAGLERPERGIVILGDRTLANGAKFVPPERRRIGMVFQDWALFPHLNVADNVAYGLPRTGTDRSRAVTEALHMVGLTNFGKRMPSTLSGGEQQRVAIARAIAPKPDALLLDEPFSNLDAALRATVRFDTRALLHDLEMTTLFVTHDQDEAFVLGDEVAVMRDGVIYQQAPPGQLYSSPIDAWVAAFVGEANLLLGEADGATARTILGPIPLAEHAVGPRRVLLRPEQIDLSPGSAGEVTSVEFYGHDCSYRVQVDGTEVIVRSIASPTFSRGDRVSVSYQGPGVVAYPTE